MTTSNNFNSGSNSSSDGKNAQSEDHLTAKDEDQMTIIGFGSSQSEFNKAIAAKVPDDVSNQRRTSLFSAQDNQYTRPELSKTGNLDTVNKV